MLLFFADSPPPVTVSIEADTDYILSLGGGLMQKGIYMMDNMLSNGSTGEGTIALNTVCPVGMNIGFSILPVVYAANQSVNLTITGFKVLEGDVFTAAGMPAKQPATSFLPDGAYWIGTVLKAGTMTYQIEGLLSSISSCTFIWTAYITAE